MGNRVLVSGPSEEPLTVDLLKEHLRIDHDVVEDELLGDYLASVRRHIEEIAGIAFLTQTWEWSQEQFPCTAIDNPFGALILRGAPLQSITSIKYQDVNNVQQTLSSSLYTVDTRSQPGRVTPVYGQTWPAALYVPNSVIVKYVCGYLNVAAIPEDLLQVLRVAAGMLYEFREELIDGTFNAVGLLPRLIAPHRVWA